MKLTGLKTWTAILVLSVVASIGANAQDVINYFYMRGEVSAPVTLKTSKGTFVVRSGDRLDGNLQIHSATDANGNAIMDLTADKTSVGTGRATVREYTFSTLYPSQRNNSGSNNKNTSSSSGNTIAEGMSKFASNFQNRTYTSRPVAGWN